MVQNSALSVCKNDEMLITPGPSYIRGESGVAGLSQHVGFPQWGSFKALKNECQLKQYRCG